MIISLTRYTTRLALRVKSLIDGSQLVSYKELQLVITRPIEEDHIGGSPWYLHGCWPHHPTDVDVANSGQAYDFPTIILDAFETDDEGRVVFILDKRVHSLPNGRYVGILRVHPHRPPINAPKPKIEPMPAPGLGIYYDANHNRVPCGMVQPKVVPHPQPCILAQFDIDLGPECAQHMIDQCAVELQRSDCTE